MGNKDSTTSSGSIILNAPNSLSLPTGLIFKKMTEVMKNIGAVSKDKKNTQQGYSFRGIDQFVNAAHKAFSNAGVFMVPEVLDTNESIREVTRSTGKTGVDKTVSLKVRFTFYAEDGSSVSATTVGEGLDSGDKATNKAMSAALKYALIQTFSVPTEDMAEADFDSPELSSTVKTTTISNESIGNTTSSPEVSIPKSEVSGTKKKTTFFKKTGSSTTTPAATSNGAGTSGDDAWSN